MSRIIYADDVTNKIQLLDFGILNTPIEQAIRRVVSDCPTAEVIKEPGENKQNEVELKQVVSMVRAFYENDIDRFNQEVEKLIEQLWDSHEQVADYLSGLRYNTNVWIPMNE